MPTDFKVALVHDFLREYGDAERVLTVLHGLYPEAPVYTAFIDYQGLGAANQYFTGWKIHPTFAQRLPQVNDLYHLYRILLPYFWESLDLSEFDLVISSSGAYLSKSILTGPQTLHVSYCHTPPRDLWNPSVDNWYDTWLNTRLRQYDFYASQRVDRFVTNSQRVARRISKFYRRHAEVIAPPVRIQGEGEAGTDYYLYVGDLSSFQQVDLAIQACNCLDRPLWIVGTGSEVDRLKRLAGSTIRFLSAVPEPHRAKIYANAKALLYPCPDADFSFSVVEAMGYGLPVIACGLSGMTEVILDYRTGLLFDQPTTESLINAIQQFESLRFASVACIERAQEFAEAVFIAKLEWFIAQSLDEPRVSGPSIRNNEN